MPLNIEGVEDLGAVQAPIQIAQRDHVADRMPSQAIRRIAVDAIESMMRSRPLDDCAALVRLQCLQIVDDCDRGTIAAPTRMGDFVPALASEEASKPNMDVTRGPVGTTVESLCAGSDMLSGDVLATEGSEVKLLRVPTDKAGWFEIVGHGPRTHEAGDGAAITKTEAGVRPADAIAISPRDLANDMAGLSTSSASGIELAVWSRYGMRANDVGSLRFSRVVDAVLNATAARDNEPKVRQKAESARTVHRPVGPRRREFEARARPHLLLERRDSIEVPAPGGAGTVDRYRRSGIRSANETSKRAEDWSEPVAKPHGLNMHVAPPETLSGLKGITIDASRVAAITKYRVHTAVDLFSTDSIEETDGVLVKGLPETKLTPASRIAFTACSMVRQVCGFSLSEVDVFRCSEAALQDCVDEEPLFNSKLDSHTRRLQSQGKSEVDASIIARDICCRQAMREAPEKFLVWCAYHVMDAMLTCCAKTGRLCVNVLNRSHREHFGTSAPLDTEKPSVLTYVAHALRDVQEFDGKRVKWSRSSQAIAERLSLLASLRKLASRGKIPKLRGLKASVLPENLLPVSSNGQTSYKKHSTLHVPQNKAARSICPLAPRPHGSRHYTKRWIVPAFQHQVLDASQTDKEAENTGTEGAPEPVSRLARRILDNASLRSQLVHVVAPVANVLIFCDPLPDWAATIVKSDHKLTKLLAQTKQEVSAAKVPDTYTAQLPRSTDDPRQSARAYLVRMEQVSATAIEIVFVLSDLLAPARVPETSARRPKLNRSDTSSHHSTKPGSDAGTELLWGDAEEEYDMMPEGGEDFDDGA